MRAIMQNGHLFQYILQYYLSEERKENDEHVQSKIDEIMKSVNEMKEKIGMRQPQSEQGKVLSKNVAERGSKYLLNGEIFKPSPFNKSSF